MKSRLLIVLILAALSTSPAHAGDQKSEALKAGGALAAGAAVGGTAFAVIGAGGLAIAGTALTVGAAPFIAVGAVVGLAGYGVYRVATEPGEPSPKPLAKITPPPGLPASKR